MNKLTILFLLLAFNVSAQYRYNKYDALIATNAYIATNAVATLGDTVSVAAGTRVDIQFRFKLINNGTLAIGPTATNPVTLRISESMDGIRFTNAWTYSLYGNAMTNTEAWGVFTTNVNYAWIKIETITSGLTNAIVTNYAVLIGQNVGF